MIHRDDNNKQVRVSQLISRTGFSLERIRLLLTNVFGHNNQGIQRSYLLKNKQLEVIAKYFGDIVIKEFFKVFEKRNSLSNRERENYERIYRRFAFQTKKSSGGDLNALDALKDALFASYQRPKTFKELSLEEIFENELNPQLIKEYFYQIIFAENKGIYIISFVWKSLLKVINRIFVFINLPLNFIFSPKLFKQFYYISDDETGGRGAFFENLGLCIT